MMYFHLVFLFCPTSAYSNFYDVVLALCVSVFELDGGLSGPILIVLGLYFWFQ
jgi:hypothetical protein